MKSVRMTKRLVLRTAAAGLLLGAGALLFQIPANEAHAQLLSRRCRQGCSTDGAQCIPGNLLTEEPGATWYWMRSPEQEKAVVMGLFNKYCIRCHGVDGRGIWDIPGIPDFTNQRWQDSRTDAQLARIILEGRGAVMPTFRGAVSLEEAWAIGRYLRTFVPGTETPRPDLKQKSDQPKQKSDQPKTTTAPGKKTLPILERHKSEMAN
jgi:mono/diheme cytochrome c family protein